MQKIIISIAFLIVVGFSVGVLTNMSSVNPETKTVYFPTDPDYDESVLEKLDWGWENASDIKKQEINQLIDKIMNDGKLNANSMMYLTDEDILIVTLYPDIHLEFSNDEIQVLLQQHTKLPIYISYDVSTDHE